MSKLRTVDKAELRETESSDIEYGSSQSEEKNEINKVNEMQVENQEETEMRDEYHSNSSEESSFTAMETDLELNEKFAYPNQAVQTVYARLDVDY